MIHNTEENLQYDDSLLIGGSLVFDCGALRGLYSTELANKGYRVIAFEPDPVGITTIPEHHSITKVQKAIGYPEGKRKFFSFLPASGANGLYLNEYEEKVNPHKSFDVDVITLETAIKNYGLPSLLKMNIEGGEVEVIMNTKDEILKSIHQMSISFHAFCGFITKEVENKCIDRIISLGFNKTLFPTLPNGIPDTYFFVRNEI